MRFQDVCNHEVAKFSQLTEAQVFSLRFYTTKEVATLLWLRTKNFMDRGVDIS